MDTGYYEKLIKKYFVDIGVETKIKGETDKDCDIALTIRIGDFYLETSFTAMKKDVEKWEKEQIV